MLSTALRSSPRRSFFTIIQQGTEGWRTFLGSNPVKLNPGIHLALPFLHQVRKVDMREGKITIEQLEAYSRDNVPVMLTGDLFYRVFDSRRATFEVQDLHESIKSMGASSARTRIGKLDHDVLTADRCDFNTALREDIAKWTEPWGTACTKFEIQTLRARHAGVTLSILASKRLGQLNPASGKASN